MNDHFVFAPHLVDTSTNEPRQSDQLGPCDSQTPTALAASLQSNIEACEIYCDENFEHLDSLLFSTSEIDCDSVSLNSFSDLLTNSLGELMTLSPGPNSELPSSTTDEPMLQVPTFGE